MCALVYIIFWLSQELSIKCGDVFHIIDEAPSARHRRSFWVSRLNDDGTDSGVGAIPNTSRAQQWLDEQGEGTYFIVIVKRNLIFAT